MNIAKLNTASLDDKTFIIKRGTSGETINNQDKVVDITENGTTEIVADGEYTGLGKVTINTEVSGVGGSGEGGGSTIEYLDVSGLEDKTVVFEWATSARLVIPQYAIIVSPVGRLVETLKNVGYDYVKAIGVDTSSIVAMRQGEDVVSVTMAEYISMAGNSELFDSIPRITKEQFYSLD